MRKQITQNIIPLEAYVTCTQKLSDDLQIPEAKVLFVTYIPPESMKNLIFNKYIPFRVMTYFKEFELYNDMPAIKWKEKYSLNICL